MRPAGPDRLALEIGHNFTDAGLATAALTHTSASAGSGPAAYQRLEFLGDRVLGLIVADMLYRRFGNAEEGELALRFNALVRRETLAGIAREMELGRHLILGPGEAQAGGRDKEAILADTLEALIGAVYLDGGLAAARALIERRWSQRLEDQTSAPQDPKTVLQEWSQGGGRGLPDYVEIARAGPDHAPVFTVEVRIEGLASARGEGSSKREAERNAASALIEREVARP